MITQISGLFSTSSATYQRKAIDFSDHLIRKVTKDSENLENICEWEKEEKTRFLKELIKYIFHKKDQK